MIPQSNTSTVRDRAAVVLDHDGQLLLVYRENERGKYYVIPGGGVDEGETVEQAAIREMQEELGIVVGDLELLTILDEPEINQRTHLFVQRLDALPELPVWQEAEEDGLHQPLWVQTSEVSGLNVLPAGLKPFLAGLSN